MQTIQFIETGQWIEAQYTERTKTLLLRGAVLRMSAQERAMAEMLAATHEIAVVRARLAGHPFAPRILKAFGLEILLDPEWPVTLASSLAGGQGRPEAGETAPLIAELAHSWQSLTNCLRPLRELTIPPELSKPATSDIVTLELRYKEERVLSVDATLAVLERIRDLYLFMCKLAGIDKVESLNVFYMTSGSSFRIDIRGLEKPISALRDLICEVWRLIRHQRAESVRANLRAVSDSLHTLEKITKGREKGHVTESEARELRARAVNATLDLFKEGALISDILPEETVSNQQLLENIQPKLLPPGSEEKSMSATPSTRKRKSTKKKSSRTGQKQ